MIDISVSNLVKEFETGNKILDGVTFQIQAGERVGLLGKNGAGKTTLLHILTGQVECDSGQVSIAPGKRVGLISQLPVFPTGYTVENVLQTAFRRLEELKQEMDQLTSRMEQDADPELLRRYGACLAAFEAGGGYDTGMQLNKVCNGLNIPPAMRRQPFASLSGGEKTRVNLARLILEDTEILLLDEPTNHLDLRATEWLEEYLTRYRGTVLTVSHDRYFLDRTIHRAIELLQGRAEFYGGNYSFYVTEKETRYQEQLKRYEKEQAKLEQLQEAADKLHLWAFLGNDKLHKRAFSIEKRMERIAVTDRPRKDRKLDLRFGEREFFGDELLTVKGLNKSYEGRTLFQEVNLKLEKGDRVALLGDNGAGKSTFLRLVVGEEQPEAGKRVLGPTVKLGYLPQIIHFSHPERNMLDTMLYELNCSVQGARDRLAAFGFRGEEVFKPVSALSGGEQSRLGLCMLMDAQINLLILDEPTNHLDLMSREWIEEAVEAYGGALLFVSHDRYFISRFANRIWWLEDGMIRDFPGNFAAYQAFRANMSGSLPPKEAPPTGEKKKRPGGRRQLEKDMAAAERDVEKAEALLRELEGEMEAQGTDYLKLQELSERKHELEAELDRRYTAWETLVQALEETS